MRKLLFVLFLSAQTFTVFAQEYQEIKGKVVDTKSNQAINAVVARVQGSNLSTLTNNEGVFLLKDVKTGEQVVVISYTGYTTKYLPVEVSENQNIDLGTILLEEDITSQMQLGLITLTENDLGDDDSGSESSAGLLQATKDPFEQAAAYNWGQAFFRTRGLDNEYGRTLINGVVMNKVHDGRPQWGNWGGLNDATRNQTYYTGTTPNDYTFGGILGTQAITTRASHIRQGTKVGFSGSDTNYNWRPYAIHSSGLNKDGWAYVVSASYRGANEGRIEGTNYDALSLFASIEKKFNDNHSVNFSAIYAQNKRGKNSPVTDEQVDLKGYKYNSYWGWQGGDKRNSRYKDVEEPIFTLTHYWKIDDKNTLNTTVGYQFGHIANSRLGYQDNLNPDPAYYQKMPSFYMNKHDRDSWAWKPNASGAADARQYFLNNGQIDWDDIYALNQNPVSIGDQGAVANRSKIVLYEDRQEENALSFNSNFKSILSDVVTFDAGVNYRRVKTQYFKKMVDLLGGDYYLDIDTYQKGDNQHSDLRHPNRMVGDGDTFGYNYNTFADIVDVFTQFRFNYRKVNFYVAQNIGYTAYEREGLYQNAVYRDHSYGKSGQIGFNNFGFKGGATVHITNKHLVTANVAYYNQAPSMKNTFANARVNNYVIPNIGNEDVFSADLSYILRTPKARVRATGYITEIKNANQINFYYADGAGLADAEGQLYNNGNGFVSEILTGVNKRSLGLEIGAEYKITSTVKATSAIAIGQSFYTNNPNIRLSSDNLAQVFDYGEAYLKNYKIGNGPQTAVSLGLEYRDPKFWWVGANVNYMADAYTNISALRRTNNFVMDPEFPGQQFGLLDKEVAHDLLKQEKLNDFTLVNITGGKSWRLQNRNIIGFFASINNVFNKHYKTGGFEQARNANYKQEILNNSESFNTGSGYNTFGNKYWYGFGRNFFVNVYYNF